MAPFLDLSQTEKLLEITAPLTLSGLTIEIEVMNQGNMKELTAWSHLVAKTDISKIEDISSFHM